MSRDRLRTTESPDGRKVATWRLVRRDCQVFNIQNRACSSSAYRWPSGTALPAAKPGLVILDGPPNLWEARDAFPRHADLWDAVRADYWDVLLCRIDVPTTIAGRSRVSEIQRQRREIDVSVRKLLAQFDEETRQKLAIAPRPTASHSATPPTG